MMLLVVYFNEMDDKLDYCIYDVFNWKIFDNI
jgi:hypothetical protein